MPQKSLIKALVRNNFCFALFCFALVFALPLKALYCAEPAPQALSEGEAPLAAADSNQLSKPYAKTEAPFKTVNDSDYIQDEAFLINPDTRLEIIKNCRELEEKAQIRFLIKTAQLKALSEAQSLVDGFFSAWVRSIGLDKRGILVYACLPEGASQGKVYLRVGIGLKYLISREMGEKILNRVIVPSNAANNDGAGFLEGVLAVKRMLLDELKRDSLKTAKHTSSFSPLSFLWASKEIIIIVLICCFLCYAVFFVERCPRCNGVLKVTSERLKEPGVRSLGLQRKIYSCDRCGFSIRKKELLYPPGKTGWVMRIMGTRRNIKVD